MADLWLPLSGPTHVMDVLDDTDNLIGSRIVELT
jgi:hypothetical protein